MSLKESSAVVLLSGGMDSTTLLYYVIKTLKYDRVEVVMFDYGQSHKVELDYAKAIVTDLQLVHKVIFVDLTQFGGSFLTSEHSDLPVNVPARNAVFLSLAAAYAEVHCLKDIFFAANSADFKDFPDCRPEFVYLMGLAFSAGYGIQGVYAPFMSMTKDEIVQLGKTLKVPYRKTWSCYTPVEIDGKLVACNKCHACEERNKVLL